MLLSTLVVVAVDVSLVAAFTAARCQTTGSPDPAAPGSTAGRPRWQPMSPGSRELVQELFNVWEVGRTDKTGRAEARSREAPAAASAKGWAWTRSISAV